MSLMSKKKGQAEVIDLDFYRRFRVILPLNPETLSKRFVLSALRSDQRRAQPLRRRSRKRQPSQKVES